MIDLYDGMNVMRRSMDTFAGHGQRLSIRQRYEASMATKPGSQIWAWDGKHHNDRRQAIYPKYKVGRTPMAEDVFSQIRLWRQLLEHSHATQIEIYGWEADDIIGTLTRRFSRKGIPVRIHSNDMDYAQLAHLPGVELVGVNTKGVPARWVPLYKAMNGDSSDRIDGIPNFGHKRWEAMEDHWAQIERAVVAGDPAGFVGLPFKPAVAAWLTDPANVQLLRDMLLVTHLENVPDDELEGGIIPGTPNRMKAGQLLNEFFL